MRITLIGKNFILKDSLPKQIDFDYWITETLNNSDNKLLNIRMNNNKYEIISTNYSTIINSKFLKLQKSNITIIENTESQISNAILDYYTVYPIQITSTNEICLLYCLPDFDDSYSNNSIIYKNHFILKKHAKIYRKNNKWIIESYDSNFAIFINNTPVLNSSKTISNGDNIFILGLQIIIIKDNIFINNPNNTVKSNPNYLKISNLEKHLYSKKNDVKLISNTDTNVVNYYSRSPKMIPPIKLEKIKIDEPPELVDDQPRPLILTIGSSVAMGIVMLSTLSVTISRNCSKNCLKIRNIFWISNYNSNAYCYSTFSYFRCKMG